MWCKSSGDITCNCKSKYIRRSTCFLLRAACFSFVMITQQRCNSPGNLDFTFFLNVCFYSLRIDSLTVWDVCDVCLTCVGFCKSHTSLQIQESSLNPKKCFANPKKYFANPKKYFANPKKYLITCYLRQQSVIISGFPAILPHLK